MLYHSQNLWFSGVAHTSDMLAIGASAGSAGLYLV